MIRTAHFDELAKIILRDLETIFKWGPETHFDDEFVLQTIRSIEKKHFTRLGWYWNPGTVDIDPVYDLTDEAYDWEMATRHPVGWSEADSEWRDGMSDEDTDVEEDMGVDLIEE